MTLEQQHGLSRDDPRVKVICQYIVEMMVLDTQPFAIVKDNGFRGQ